MEEFEEVIEDRGTLRITFTGYVLPHWRYEFVEGDRSAIEDLVRRANTVIGLLPPRDPQFRRNRDRVDRDGTREGITVEWVGVDIDDDRREKSDAAGDAGESAPAATK